MRIYYVELEKAEYYFSEVTASSQEDAENQVLSSAPGDPQDWKIVRSEVVEHRATYGSRQ